MNPQRKKFFMERSHSQNSVKAYISSIYEGEGKILENIKKSITDNDLRQINIDEYEGQILQFLVSICNAKKVVEIGTLVGYSTIWIAKALPEDGKVYTFEADKKTYEVAKNNFLKAGEYSNKINLIFGNAHEKLEDIESQGSFDAIFIDAEKRGYPEYLDWAEKNIRKDGFIIADNTFLNGAVTDESLVNDKNIKQVMAMKEFNQRLADKDKYQSIILPTAEGLSVAKKLF